MKKWYLFPILFLFPIYIIAQHTWLNPKPQGNSLYDVCFVNEFAGYTVGAFGTVLKTMDMGTNWTVQNSGTTMTLHSVYFIDENRGFIVGDSGVILSTTSQGESWNIQSSETKKNLHAVFFTDSLVGYSCGEAGCILKTINGGLNWEHYSGNIPANLYDIDFPDPETGYIVGGKGPFGEPGYILKSTDAGENWTLLSDTLYESFYSVDFTDTLTGYAAGNFSCIVKTEDGGNNWSLLDNPNLNNNDHIRSINFLNDHIGFTCDVFGNIMKTEDSGQSWINISLNQYILYSIQILNSTTLGVVGHGGIILLSEDGGETFTNMHTGSTSELISINRTDVDHMFVMGHMTLIKTNDAGNTWETIILPDLSYIIDAQFLNNIRGYALNQSGIYNTTDGGDTWTKVHNLNKASWMSDLFMVDENFGYAVGGGQSPGGWTWGTLLKTINGINWQEVYCPSGTYLNKVYFKDPFNGYLLGSDGNFYESEDQGSNWLKIELGTMKSLVDMTFVSENIGYLLGSSYYLGNIIFKTVDGGKNWDLVYEDISSSSTGSFRSFSFSDSLTGSVVGTYGCIVKTNDGGTSWINQPGFTDNWLNSVLMVNDSSGYIAGGLGTFASFGSVGTSIPQRLIELPDPLKPFPNPFVFSFDFELYSNVHEMVCIEIYDLKGVLVEQSYNMLSRGNQIVQYTPVNTLDRGIYFIKIRGENIYCSGKIIKSQ